MELKPVTYSGISKAWNEAKNQHQLKKRRFRVESSPLTKILDEGGFISVEERSALAQTWEILGADSLRSLLVGTKFFRDMEK